MEVKIHRDCMILWSSDVFFFWIHRNLIFLLHPDVSGIYGFWSIHRKCPHLGPFRCIVTLVSVGDTSGLRFQCPSRCTEVQISIYNTSGWANIGHFRCIAKNCQNKIHRDSSIHNNPDVSKPSIHRNYSFIPDPDVFILISRDCTCFPLQNTPAQAGINPAGYIGICYSRGIPMYLLQITTQPPDVLALTQSASYTSPRTA